MYIGSPYRGSLCPRKKERIRVGITADIPSSLPLLEGEGVQL
jgi:hypothetical protein